MWQFLVIICLFQCTNAVTPPQPELVLIQAIWRHGDRSPVELVPTDAANGPDTWPQGPGELTTLGMHQHFTLGTQLRKLYVDRHKFLSGNYSDFEIYMYSDDYNRTLQSAASNLAAMYPPFPDQIPLPWSKDYNLNWQPIPIHTKSKTYDYAVWPGNPCPAYDRWYQDQIDHSPYYAAYMKDYKPVFDVINKNYGNNKTLNIDSVWEVFDPLYVESVHSPPRVLPPWVYENVTTATRNDTRTVFEHLEVLQNISFAFLYFNQSYDGTKINLRGGVLLDKILTNMQQKAAGDPKFDWRLKYLVYSAHDTTVTTFLDTLGTYVNMSNYEMPAHTPGYTACIVVELWRKTPGNDPSNFEVKIRYRNAPWKDMSNDSEVQYVQVKGCDGVMSQNTGCSLDSFLNRSADIRVNRTTYESMCFEGEPLTTDAPMTHAPVPVTYMFPADGYDYKPLAIGMGVLAGVLLCLTVLMFTLYMRNRDRKYAGYRPLYDMQRLQNALRGGRSKTTTPITNGKSSNGRNGPGFELTQRTTAQLIDDLSSDEAF